MSHENCEKFVSFLSPMFMFIFVTRIRSQRHCKIFVMFIITYRIPTIMAALLRYSLKVQSLRAKDGGLSGTKYITISRNPHHLKLLTAPRIEGHLSLFFLSLLCLF